MPRVTKQVAKPKRQTKGAKGVIGRIAPVSIEDLGLKAKASAGIKLVPYFLCFNIISKKCIG